MSPVFSFGFEVDGDEAEEALVAPAPAQVLSTSADQQAEPANVEIQQFDANEALSFAPSSRSYAATSIRVHDGLGCAMPLREFFDIRAQLMAEDKDAVLASLKKSDLCPQSYEGGFKTWECAVALAAYVLEQYHNNGGFATHDRHLIELGAGTSLPSLALFWLWLKECPHSRSGTATLHLSLADYNTDVLRLASFPNMFLTHHYLVKNVKGDADVDITQDGTARFLHDLALSNVLPKHFSGPWSSDLAHAISERTSKDTAPEVLVLASETIYSPASLDSFVATLVSILQDATRKGCRASALVAAKRVYFGVGGGVDEFVDRLKSYPVHSSIVWEGTTGVSQVIVRVRILVTD